MKLLNKFVIQHRFEYGSSTSKMHLPSPIFCVLHMTGISQNCIINSLLTVNKERSDACGEK